MQKEPPVDIPEIFKRHLCKSHFIEDIERKIKRDIRKFKLVGRGEKIAVALKWGKDSIAYYMSFIKYSESARP